MSKNNLTPSRIVPLVITAVNDAEKTKLPGPVKQINATMQVMNTIKSGLNPSDIIKWAGIVYGLIKALVDVYNKFFGKNGWSETGFSEKQ